MRSSDSSLADKGITDLTPSDEFLDHLVATQDDHLPDVTIECPCGCGGRVGPKVEQVNGEWVCYRFSRTGLREFLNLSRLNPHPRNHSLLHTIDKEP
jgi:hypothetical protein